MSKQQELEAKHLRKEIFYIVEPFGYPNYTRPQLEEAVSKLEKLFAAEQDRLIKDIEAHLPEKKEHFIEARLDNDLDHGRHLGKTDGFNEALELTQAILSSYRRPHGDSEEPS